MVKNGQSMENVWLMYGYEWLMMVNSSESMANFMGKNGYRYGSIKLTWMVTLWQPFMIFNGYVIDFSFNGGYMGVSINGGIQNGWFLLGNIPLKWMRTGGTSISGNHHIMVIYCHATIQWYIKWRFILIMIRGRTGRQKNYQDTWLSMLSTNGSVMAQ